MYHVHQVQNSFQCVALGAALRSSTIHHLASVTIILCAFPKRAIHNAWTRIVELIKSLKNEVFFKKKQQMPFPSLSLVHHAQLPQPTINREVGFPNKNSCSIRLGIGL